MHYQSLYYFFCFILLLRGSENAVEEYLEIITELLVYNEFVNDYNAVYNLVKDIKKCQKINKEM